MNRDSLFRKTGKNFLILSMLWVGIYLGLFTSQIFYDIPIYATSILFKNL